MVIIMSGNIVVCVFCGKLFQSGGTKYCLACSAAIDEAFVTARNYIYDTEHDVSFKEMLDNTDINEKILSFLIKEGRLTLNDMTGSNFKCIVCGRKVTSGRMCESCSAKFAEEASKISSSAPNVSATNKNSSQTWPPVSWPPISYNK